MNRLVPALMLIFLFSSFIFPQGYVCAVGGGNEDYNDWSDGPYSWIVQKSDSGKILILSYEDATEWIPDYFKSLGAAEAVNLKIGTRTAADLQSTYDELITAKAVFLKGGDQYSYISLWKGTKTEEAIKFIFNSGGVVAGTSAGEAVLGDVDFSASSGSAYPFESLKDPFYSRMKFEGDFLDLVPGVLFDSHFIERGRFGRLIPMLLNIKVTLNKNITGIGVDDRTAFCINPDLTGTVMGSGAVSVFYADDNTLMDKLDGSYIIERLKCDQLTDGWIYDLNTRSIVSTPPSAQAISTAELSLPQTNFMLAGSSSLADNRETLAHFLMDLQRLTVLIISHEGYTAVVNEISSFVDSLGYPVTMLNINPASIIEQASADKIREASCYIFAGDSLSLLNLLSDTGTAASLEFQAGIKAGKPAFFFGNTGKLAGGYFVDNTDIDYLASWRGKMKTSPALSLFDDLIFQPFVFNNEDFYENRSSSVLWGMMRNRKRFGVFLNYKDVLVFNAEEQTISASGETPYIFVDASNTTLIDSSVYKTGIGPRQVAAMNNLLYSVSNMNDVGYSLKDGSFYSTVTVKDNNTVNNFTLEQNYPNPFNPETNFNFSLDVSGFVSFKLFDILGREIAVLLNKEMSAGKHNLKFNASGLSSGVYFARLQFNSVHKNVKINLIK
jgi:cyanophycinase